MGIHDMIPTIPCIKCKENGTKGECKTMAVITSPEFKAWILKAQVKVEYCPKCGTQKWTVLKLGL
jgi:hypothetical protein